MMVIDDFQENQDGSGSRCCINVDAIFLYLVSLFLSRICEFAIFSSDHETHEYNETCIAMRNSIIL